MVFLNFVYSMKKNIRNIALLLAILPPFAAWCQQDPQYSLYMFDKMAVNPAAAGSKDALEANILSRLQWVGIPGGPTTNALLISTPVASKKVGWGLEVMDDAVGPTNSALVQLNYAYNIPVGNGKLAMGLGLGVYNYAIDFTKIDYKDKTDQYAMTGNTTTLAPTAEFGLYYHNESWYMGLSFNHLIESNITTIATDTNATFKPHGYFIAGKAFKSKSGIIWNPSIIFQFAQNAPPAASINMNVLLAEKIWLGVSLKPGYGVVFLAAYKVSQVMSIGYSYDLGLNAIGQVGGGSHELALTFDFARYKAAQFSPRFF
jgi:type IX secretion system PorP/SprF family membrane protein